MSKPSVQRLLRRKAAPRLTCESHWRTGLWFHLFLPLPDGGEYIKASGPLNHVMRYV